MLIFACNPAPFSPHPSSDCFSHVCHFIHCFSLKILQILTRFDIRIPYFCTPSPLVEFRTYRLRFLTLPEIRMHTGSLAGPCESQSCLCACCANVNVSSDCSVAPLIACEYQRRGRQRRRLNMLCFACYRTFTPHANLSILLPTLHSRTCASQLCTVQRLTSLYANLGYRTHRQMCANFRLEPLKLCEGQLTPHPSTHANFSQCSPHSVCVCECRGIGQRSAVPMRLPTLHAPICVRLSAYISVHVFWMLSSHSIQLRIS